MRPTLREKRRYMLLEFNGRKEEVIRCVKEFLGDLGSAKANPEFVKSGKKWAVLKVERKFVDDVRASFVLSPFPIKVIKVSGTIKKIRKLIEKRGGDKHA